jgi:hypothetical protein
VLLYDVPNEIAVGSADAWHAFDETVKTLMLTTYQ